MADVVLERLTKTYADGTNAVSALDLTARDGEFLVLVGPSGCGKTTALRMVAGLEEISAGSVRIGDRVVNDLPSRDRDIAMVFQSYALYPHLSVFENMAFGLRVKRMPKTEIAARVGEAARVLDLEPLLARKPRALSGGQRQRVAMGRAIVRRPQVFLMDEPLSNLDAKLRVLMRAEIGRLQRDLATTTLYVTHDQVEAMTMGHRVAVMCQGQLQQVAPPQELYDRPVNLFVAGFIGSPAMNLLDATVRRNGQGGFAVDVGTTRLQVDPEAVAARPALSRYVGSRVILGIRPEDLEDAAIAAPRSPGRQLTGTVRLREALGSESLVHLDLGVRAPSAAASGAPATDGGTDALAERARNTVVGRFSARSRARRDDVLDAAVDTRSLHFFDPQTSRGIYA